MLDLFGRFLCAASVLEIKFHIPGRAEREPGIEKTRQLDPIASRPGCDGEQSRPWPVVDGRPSPKHDAEARRLTSL